MHIRRTATDLFFYVALPYVLWMEGRHALGSYLGLLVSTAPSFAYGLYCFIRDRQYQVSGLFILGALVISSAMDLLSGSAEAALANNVITKYTLGAFVLTTLLLRKPIAYYFAVDLDVLRGRDRNASAVLYQRHQLMPYLRMITLLFGTNYMIIGTLKYILIRHNGISHYDVTFLFVSGIEGALSALHIAAWWYLQRKARPFREQRSDLDTIPEL